MEAFNWGNIFATNYPTTTNTGIAIGASDPGVTRTLTFSQAVTNQAVAVTNPYIYASFLDGVSELSKSVFLFSQPFNLVQANNARIDPSDPNKVVAIVDTFPNGAHNRESDGFVVQMQGTFTSINFEYRGFNITGQSQFTDTVLFTTGVGPTSEPTPGPLPLMGAMAAFGYSRIAEGAALRNHGLGLAA